MIRFDELPWLTESSFESHFMAFGGTHARPAHLPTYTLRTFSKHPAAPPAPPPPPTTARPRRRAGAPPNGPDLLWLSPRRAAGGRLRLGCREGRRHGAALPADAPAAQPDRVQRRHRCLRARGAAGAGHGAPECAHRQGRRAAGPADVQPPGVWRRAQGGLAAGAGVLRRGAPGQGAPGRGHVPRPHHGVREGEAAQNDPGGAEPGALVFGSLSLSVDDWSAGVHVCMLHTHTTTPIRPPRTHKHT